MRPLVSSVDGLLYGILVKRSDGFFEQFGWHCGVEKVGKHLTLVRHNVLAVSQEGPVSLPHQHQQ